MSNEPIPDDAVIGVAEEDIAFLSAYTDGQVSEEDFLARYRQPDGTIAIPAILVDPGTVKVVGPIRVMSAEDLGIGPDDPGWASEDDIEAMFGAPREDEDEDLDDR